MNTRAGEHTFMLHPPPRGYSGDGPAELPSVTDFTHNNFSFIMFYDRMMQLSNVLHGCGEENLVSLQHSLLQASSDQAGCMLGVCVCVFEYECVSVMDLIGFSLLINQQLRLNTDQ